MMTIYDLIKQVIFLVGVAAAYLVSGWQLATLLIAGGMGFLFERFIVTTAVALGLLLHGGGVVYNYLWYVESTEFILQKTAILMRGLPMAFFPIFTILFPAMLYGLAAYFSIHLAQFIRTYKP